jgi:hypothetical protein
MFCRKLDYGSAELMKLYEPRPIGPIDQPLEVLHVEDEIVVVGPGSVAFSMTMSAARATCKRLGELLNQIESS